MTDNTKEIQIEEEGFVTTKKGLTLSSISLFIWILTNILYTILNEYIFEAMGYPIDQVSFCFFVSLSLSGLLAFYITKKFVKNLEMASKLIIIISNILLLYTSANGIHAGYSFLSNPKVSSAFVIPFISTKPWLPDEYQSSQIQILEDKNELLNERIEVLEEYTADKSELIEETESLKKEIQNLKDSVNKFSDYYNIKNDLNELNTTNDNLIRLNRDLKAQIENLTRMNESSENELENLTRLNKDLEAKMKNLQNNYSTLEKDFNILIDRCKDINELRRENERLKKDNAELNKEIRSLKSEIKRWNSNYSSLKKSYDELKEECGKVIVQ